MDGLVDPTSSSLPGISPKDGGDYIHVGRPAPQTFAPLARHLDEIMPMQ
jgi:hypothetical protein